LAVFPFGDGNKLVVYSETSWEVTQPLLYEVYAGRQLVIRATAFYYRNPDKPMPQFHLVSGGSVVGIVADSAPRELLIMFDSSSSKSWPYSTDTETLVESQGKRKELLAAMNARSKDGFYLGDH
jgi:hypothetical protein